MGIAQTNFSDTKGVLKLDLSTTVEELKEHLKNSDIPERAWAAVILQFKFTKVVEEYLKEFKGSTVDKYVALLDAQTQMLTKSACALSGGNVGKLVEAATIAATQIIRDGTELVGHIEDDCDAPDCPKHGPKGRKSLLEGLIEAIALRNGGKL